MNDMSKRTLGTAVAFSVAIGCGVFLAVASDTLDWSGGSVAAVGLALAALLGLLGTPLVLLPLGGPERTPHPRGSVRRTSRVRATKAEDISHLAAQQIPFQLESKERLFDDRATDIGRLIRQAHSEFNSP